MLHNTVDLVGSSLLGLTLQCARCHDHKFDPIAQKEYYQLMAFLTPAYNPARLAAGLPVEGDHQGPGCPMYRPARRMKSTGTIATSTARWLRATDSSPISVGRMR